MRIGRVEVTVGFLLLAAWLNYLDRQAIVPLALLACGLHELGHYGAIRWMGGSIRQLRLTAVGAEMELSSSLGYWQEAVAALAGPGANLLLALIFCRWQWGQIFAGLNLVLGCFNLLPAGGLDGGRLLFCLLASMSNTNLAWRVGGCLDRVVTALLLALGILLVGAYGNLTLLLVAVWMLTAVPSQKFRR